MITRIAETTLETVHIDPRAAGFVSEVGAHVRAVVPHLELAGNTLRRVHADDIARIEENDPKMRAWDQAAHDD
jgi:hypothetical protein